MAFLVMPKRPRNLLLFALAVWIGLRLAGPYVRERFMSSFVSAEQRDPSAQSRLELWKNCWDAMLNNPATGLGPDCFPYAARDIYGWWALKEAHMLWLNAGAELGFPGLGFLAGYYGLSTMLLWRRLRQRRLDSAWQENVARGVIVSLGGFAVSASFVALDALEPPYFLAMLGAGMIRVADAHAWESGESEEPRTESLFEEAASPA
jgi:O-antigen ligase